MSNRPKALVLGCGVSGLTSAICLQEAGWQVSIRSSSHPQETTSNTAGAVWFPYRADPKDRVLAWGAQSFKVFNALARDPASGVHLREGIELWREPVPDPWWRDAVPQFGRAPVSGLPSPYLDAYTFAVPVIEMPVYLPYLLDRFETGGGKLILRTVGSRDELCNVARLVVNCTGLGARELFGDLKLYPVRGQMVRVVNPGLTRFVIDEHDPEGMSYIIPRSSDCLLGGTADEGCWELAPDECTATAILDRCVRLEPRLVGARVLEDKVGLRPARSAIRLEREHSLDGTLWVHNYGHGGSGVTLSWGCAQEVARLAGCPVS
jgi:D-amino-acid oxidase